MLTLYKSPNFQEDYKRYQTKIAEVSDEAVRNRLTELLNKLVSEVKNIDALHHDMFNRRTLPGSTADSKNKLVELRKQLDAILRDWTEAQSH